MKQALQKRYKELHDEITVTSDPYQVGSTFSLDKDVWNQKTIVPRQWSVLKSSLLPWNALFGPTQPATFTE